MCPHFRSSTTGQAIWFIFKGIFTNQTIGWKLFKMKTFHIRNDNFYGAQTGQNYRQAGQTHCQMFFKEAPLRNSPCILCFRK